MLPDGYRLEPLRPDDAAALAAAYDRNRDHLARWDPARSEHFFTEAGQRAEVAARLEVVERGLGVSWLLWHGEEVVGRVGLNNVVRGVFCSASVGYFVDGAHTRRGLATAMVRHAAEHAAAIGLHRVEAGTLVDNVGSQRVLLGCGFERYGEARDYLFIAGAWRDHVLFQRILHDRPAGAPAP